MTALTAPQVLAIQQRLEKGYRRQPAVDHQLIHQLTMQATPTEPAVNCWSRVLSEALHISTGKANRRLKQAALLGPRTAAQAPPSDDRQAGCRRDEPHPRPARPRGPTMK